MLQTCRPLGNQSGRSHLEEEGALVLSLRAGRPKPVGQRASFSRGHKVAESQWLLEDVGGLLVRLHTIRALALERTKEDMDQSAATIERLSFK